MSARLAVAWQRIGQGGDLWPAEESAIARARPKRRAEFAAGRSAARQAMAALDLPRAAIPMAEDRAPIWPEGVCGCISHDDHWAICVASISSEFRALGVDLEPNEDLPQDLFDEVLSKSELTRIEGEGNAARLARQIFSAKEAAYKALYPMARESAGFDLFEITLHPPTAQLTRDYGPYAAGTRFRLNLHCSEGHILTSLLLIANELGENGALVHGPEMLCFQSASPRIMAI